MFRPWDTRSNRGNGAHCCVSPSRMRQWKRRNLRAVETLAHFANDQSPQQPAAEEQEELNFRKKLRARYARELVSANLEPPFASGITPSTMKQWKRDSLNYGRRTYALFDDDNGGGEAAGDEETVPRIVETAAPNETEADHCWRGGSAFPLRQNSARDAAVENEMQ